MAPPSARSYLQLMDRQLEAALTLLSAVDAVSLWARPSIEEWSPAEPLSHATAVPRFFRRLNQVLWPISSLIARQRLHSPFRPTIDDIYARPGFPHAIGRIWPPSYSYRRPTSLQQLSEEIRKEHGLLHNFYGTKDEEVLGHAPLYYPSTGRVNYTQSLRIAIFHDAHHFAEIKNAVSSARDKRRPGA